MWCATQDGDTEAQTLGSPLTGFRRELTFKNIALFLLPAKGGCGQGPQAPLSCLSMSLGTCLQTSCVDEDNAGLRITLPTYQHEVVERGDLGSGLRSGG